MKHVMIDLETMGTFMDSAIVTIGACLFNPDTGKIGDKFYEKINWINRQTRKIDPSTIKWWLGQSDDARKELTDLDDAITLSLALSRLEMFIPKGAYVWANGATFDITMLEHAYVVDMKKPSPWGFRNIRDCRTISHMAEGFYNMKDFVWTGEAHNALDDAINQARWVSDMWQILVTNKALDEISAIGQEVGGDGMMEKK